MAKTTKEGVIIENEITFTADEANNLIEILHIAVKAEGLNVSKACTHFQEKLQSHFTAAQTEEVKETEKAEA